MIALIILLSISTLIGTLVILLFVLDARNKIIEEIRRNSR